MFCKKCGAQVDDDAIFCSSCGARLKEEQTPRFQEEVRTYSQPEPQPTYAAPYDTPEARFQEETPYYTQPEPQKNKQSGLGWHNFLIYFALWAGAVINLANGLSTITGSAYGDEKNLVYIYFKGLKTVDVACGLVLIFMAAFGIYVRFQLANFKKGAPKLLSLMYIIGIASTFIYLMAASSVTGLNLMSAENVGNVFGSVTFLIINYFYYKKRLHLFVN